MAMTLVFLCVSAEYETIVPDLYDVDEMPAAEGPIAEIFRATNSENERVVLKHPTNGAWVEKGITALDDIFGREARVLKEIDSENVLKCHDFIGESSRRIMDTGIHHTLKSERLRIVDSHQHLGVLCTVPKILI